MSGHKSIGERTKMIRESNTRAKELSRARADEVIATRNAHTIFVRKTASVFVYWALKNNISYDFDDLHTETITEELSRKERRQKKKPLSRIITEGSQGWCLGADDGKMEYGSWGSEGIRYKFLIVNNEGILDMSSQLQSGSHSDMMDVKMGRRRHPSGPGHRGADVFSKGVDDELLLQFKEDVINQRIAEICVENSVEWNTLPGKPPVTGS